MEFLSLPEDTVDQLFYKLEVFFDFKARYVPLQMFENKSNKKVEVSRDELLERFNFDIRNRINVLIIKYNRMNIALEDEREKGEKEEIETFDGGNDIKDQSNNTIF
jgi:hypothetical protein